MRVRKRLSSSSPRSPGIDRFGHSGLDSPQFHTGKVLVLKTNNPLRRRRRCGHAPLIDARCFSCGLDHRSYQLARDHRHRQDHHLDDDDSLGDDLDRRGRFD